MRYRMFARLSDWSRGVEFMYSRVDYLGKIFYRPEIKDDEFVETDTGARPLTSTFFLEMSDAQSLMDELWNCGLRPSEGTGSAGSLKATQNHLEDMRRIAFDLLNKKND